MKKTNEISIADNKRVGILKVKYDGDTFAIFNYCREGDEKEQCYPTRERAVEMAKMVARHLIHTNPIMTERGIDLCTEGEEGHFTKKQAKKLTEKLVRKIENSTTIKTKKGFKLKRNNNDQR